MVANSRTTGCLECVIMEWSEEVEINNHIQKWETSLDSLVYLQLSLMYSIVYVWLQFFLNNSLKIYLKMGCEFTVKMWRNINISRKYNHLKCVTQGVLKLSFYWYNFNSMLLLQYMYATVTVNILHCTVLQ